MLLVLLLVAIAIGVIVGVIVLGVQLSKNNKGGSHQPTLAVIVASVLVVAGCAGFGIQEWRFRCVRPCTAPHRIADVVLCAGRSRTSRW